MSLPLFYVPDFDPNAPALSAEESQHATKVLRLRAGAAVAVTNGKGGWYTGKVVDTGKVCHLHIDRTEQRPAATPTFHLACAPTKNNNRFEWMLEKTTELGIQQITPLICAHSERRVVKGERLEKVLAAAMKQSQQAWIPTLDAATAFKQLIQSPFDGQRFIAWCGDEEDPMERLLLKDRYLAGSNALVLIGPEGDFSPEEVQQAMAAGFEPISLGPNRLRTETAALAACHTFQLMNL